MIRFLKTRVFVAIALLLISGLSWYFLSRPQTVVVARPTRGPAVEAVYATGTVESSVMLPLAPRNSGRLVELRVDEGSQVEPEQILARLEDTELRQNVSELKAREDLAAEEAKRQALLFEKNTISEEEFERASYAYEAAIAARKAAEAQMSYLTLKAPVEGRIIRRDGEVGELIAANQPVFWLAGEGPLRVTAEVDEEDIPKVKAGQTVLIQADSFPSKVFQGEIASVTPQGDPVARSYRVRIKFTEEVPFMIGMTAECNIVLRKAEKALLVPTSAVLKDALWAVRENQLVRLEVSIGARGPDRTEVLNGLKTEEFVVIQPKSSFQEGQVVRSVLQKQ